MLITAILICLRQFIIKSNQDTRPFINERRLGKRFPFQDGRRRENATRIFVLRRVWVPRNCSYIERAVWYRAESQYTKKVTERLQPFKKQRRIRSKRTESKGCWNNGWSWMLSGIPQYMAHSSTERRASSQKCSGRNCSRTRSRRS